MLDPSNASHLAPATRGERPAESGSNPSAVHQQPLTDRMAQGAHHTIDRLAETAAPHIDRMEGAVADATRQLKDQARHALDKGDEWVDDVRAAVRRNPLSAVAAALALGALMVRLTR